MPRGIPFTSALLFALTVTACGGSDPAAEPPASGSSGASSATSLGESDSSQSGDDGGGVDAAVPFEITETAYQVDASFGDVYVQWTAVIENPNTDVYGTFPTVSITGRDKSGSVIGTEDQVLISLPPGGTIAFASQVTMTEKPAEVEIEYKSVDWYDTETTPDDYPPFEASDLRYKKQEFGGLVTTGELSNPYEFPVESLAATALYRGSGGELIGGATSFLENLPAAGTMPMQIEELGSSIPAGRVDSVDVVVIDWGQPETWNKLAAGEDPSTG